MLAYSSLLLLLLMPVMLVDCCLVTMGGLLLYTTHPGPLPSDIAIVAPYVDAYVIGILGRLQSHPVYQAGALTPFVLLHKCPALSTFARSSYDMTTMTTSLRISGSMT